MKILAPVLALLLAPLRLGYALWAVVAFAAVSLGVLLLIVLLPGVMRRRAAARSAARVLLRLAGMRLTVRGSESLPAINGPAIRHVDVPGYPAAHSPYSHARNKSRGRCALQWCASVRLGHSVLHPR